MSLETIKFQIEHKQNDLSWNAHEIDSTISQITRHQKTLEKLFDNLKKAEKESDRKSIERDIRYENDQISSLQNVLKRLQNRREQIQNEINILNAHYADALKAKNEEELKKQQEVFQRQQEAQQRAIKEQQRKQEKELKKQKGDSFKRKNSTEDLLGKASDRSGCLYSFIQFVRVIAIFIIVLSVIGFAIGLVHKAISPKKNDAEVSAGVTQNNEDQPNQVNAIDSDMLGITGETDNKNENTSFFDEAPENAVGAIYIKVDELFIRTIPSTEGNTPKGFAEKDSVHYVFDIYQDDKYTWYKIGEDEWVADYNREWAEFFQDFN